MELNIKDMTAEQIADAKAQIEAWEARQSVKKLAWKPEVCEEYWYPCIDGSTDVGEWLDRQCDNRCYKQGSVMTNELADYTIKTRATIHQIHEWIDENDSERGGRFFVCENNWILRYDVVDDGLDASCCISFITSTLPSFSSPEKVNQCIKDVGEENIKLLFKRYDIVRGDE